MIFMNVDKIKDDFYKKSSNIYKAIKERWLLIGMPYGWLFVFFFIPFLLILKTSFSETVVAAPPISDITNWVNKYLLQININLENYYLIFTDSFYVSAFLSSTKIAVFATLGCLLLGYPIAYGISRTKEIYRPYLLLLIALPFWTSFLIRVYAWMSILSTKGLVNYILQKVGITSVPLELLNNSYSVCLGIIYCYLPFMIFPIYASLSKINDSYIEAAFDLGCRPWQAFYRVTAPLSFSGVLAGAVLVFIPAIGEFVIPELLGGPDTLMIGRALWWEFFNNRNWSLASALAVIMVILFVAPIMAFQRQKIGQSLRKD